MNGLLVGIAMGCLLVIGYRGIIKPAMHNYSEWSGAAATDKINGNQR